MARELNMAEERFLVAVVAAVLYVPHSVSTCAHWDYVTNSNSPSLSLGPSRKVSVFL